MKQRYCYECWEPMTWTGYVQNGISRQRVYECKHCHTEQWGKEVALHTVSGAR